eukprot:TRINITY_DN48281_c0_g1_i1.p1 TRINITY_DN48281_c0_g1~~TRINITY_DN48281_c0_g1_i1.p1  ORF type:complete len:240 (+),score=39.54 TRINITY_DN48281_c0_g1_i1:40-759(+)
MWLCCSQAPDSDLPEQVAVESSTAEAKVGFDFDKLEDALENPEGEQKPSPEERSFIEEILPTATQDREGEEPEIWKVKFVRAKDQPLGVTLDFTEGALPIVIRVEGAGLVADWNSSSKQEEQVEERLALKQVNTATTGEAISKAIEGTGDLELTFVRPFERSVSIVKGGDSLGVKLGVPEGSKFAIIKTVLADGLGHKFGLTAGDIVCAVNGQTENPRDLCTKIVQEDRLDLKLMTFRS